MNEILIQRINSFVDSVIVYLKLEYNSVYFERLNEDRAGFFDFIGSYYMGGSTVPEAARYFVDLLKIRVN